MDRKSKEIPIIHLPDLGLSARDGYFYAGRLEELPDSFREYESSHRHSYFAIFLFLEGSGEHTIDFEHYTIGPGSLFFLKPGQVHSWTFQSKPAGFALKISPEYFSEVTKDASTIRDFSFFQIGRSRSKMCLDASEQLRSDFARLADEYANGAERRMLYTLSQLILLQIEKEYGIRTGIAPEEAVAFAFQRILEEHFLTRRSTSFYSRRLFLSPASLNRECHRTLGKSAKAIIHDRIVLEIKRLLIHSNHSMNQICHELGFSDNAYFSRYFKKRTGVSPESYRSEKRKAQQNTQTVHLH